KERPSEFYVSVGDTSSHYIAEFFPERRVVGRHPSGQPVENALRHLRGGGLRVRETKDALRRRTSEQKAQHAQRQNVRLAGAGVGVDPGRNIGIGGGALRSVGELPESIGGQLFGFEVHGAASSSTCADHSATRAKCA